MKPGVVEVRANRLTASEVAQVPVEAIRIIYGVSEVLEAAAHVAMLRAAGKYVVACIRAPTPTVRLDLWRAAVKRFVTAVPAQAIEVWNEPQPQQLSPYWPRLRVASEEIRESGKACVMGGSPPAWAQAYYKAAHEADVLKWVDGVGLHPYMPDPLKQLNWVRDRRAQLDGYGCPKPLFLTEFGWGTKGTFSKDTPTMRVTEAVQADYLTKAFRNLATVPRIAVACWFCWKDYGGSQNWDHFTGVRRLDGSPKPAYQALTNV